MGTSQGQPSRWGLTERTSFGILACASAVLRGDALAARGAVVISEGVKRAEVPGEEACRKGGEGNGRDGSILTGGMETGGLTSWLQTVLLECVV